MIIAVGFKVNNERAVQFRKWANNIVKDYTIKGWAMDDEEYQPGHRCVGAPVFDYRGDAVAAVSASGTAAEISDQSLEKIKQAVIQSAHKISHRMGFIP